jgi:ribosomal protein L23
MLGVGDIRHAVVVALVHVLLRKRAKKILGRFQIMLFKVQLIISKREIKKHLQHTFEWVHVDGFSVALAVDMRKNQFPQPSVDSVTANDAVPE